MHYLIYDIETRSTLSLRQVGSHTYSCDPTTDIWCVSYCSVNNGERGPISTWLPSEPIPAEILAAADCPDLHALPGSLDKVAAALKLPQRKTLTGAMKLLAQPRKVRKDEDSTQIYWHNEPERLATLYEYNRIDVEMTAAIIQRLGFLSPGEQKVWQLDAAINARGIHIDVELLDAALNIAAQGDAELRAKLATLTDGVIDSPSQTARILKWLAQQGCEVSDVQEETMREALKRPGLQPAAEQLIKLRLAGAHAAVNKLVTLRRWIGDDDRVHQVYRYHGAMPGRWTSLGAQMQNLKKPTIDAIPAAIENVRSGSLTQMRAQYEQPLAVVGDITRGLITAAPGCRLFIADLSGIESRGLAWIANETTKLEAWRKYDCSGNSEDEPYYITGAKTFRQPQKLARKVGKTGDLAFGYMGSIGAWRRLAPTDDNATDDEIRSRQRAWRREHPNIVRFWTAAVRQAVKAVGGTERFTAARIAFQREGNFLHMELPSGRRISYPFARPLADRDGMTFTFRDNAAGRWGWYHLLRGGGGVFGGLLAENATQAVCRDVFVAAMLRLEAAGYHIVAHLHDEFVCEVPNDFGSLDEFLSIITTPPTWAPDFPVAAKGRIADRFIEIKDEPVDGAAVLQPVTQANLDEINTGLKREGIEPINIDREDDDGNLPRHIPTEQPEITHHGLLHAVESETPTTPNTEFPLPPPEFNDPPPRSNGHAGNGFDAYAAGEEPRGAPMGQYVYKDARGQPFMRVIRTSAKSFPTQHWHDGKWVNGWPKEPLIPYRLPQLLAAPATEPIWICEGEKDADSVVALGLTATTNPGGAGKWRPDLTQHFQGKERIYIAEDNDDPGRAHTRKIAAALQGVVPNITVVPFSELPVGGDVSDWLDMGHSKEELIARAQAAPQNKPPRLAGARASSFEMEALDWLWPDRFALGKVGLIAGLPDEGKGQLLCYVMAQVTTGGAWPCEEGYAQQGNVILLTAEDDINDTVVPRLAAAGADLDRVEIIGMVRDNTKDRMFNIATDLDLLREKIVEVRDVRMVQIDPITAYLGVGKIDSFRNTDVRAVLAPLVELAAELNVAVIAIMHFNKKIDITNAMLRISDSLAFAAVARHVYGVVDDAENDRKLFVRAKNNVAAKSKNQTLAFRFATREVGADRKTGKAIWAPYIVWEEGYIDVSAMEAMQAAATNKSPTVRDAAKKFLFDILSNGPVLRTEIEEAADANDITERTLRRAKTDLNIVAEREDPRDPKSKWMWRLPDDLTVKGGLT